MIRLGIFAYIQTYARYWGTNLTIYGWGTGINRYRSTQMKAFCQKT